MSLRFAAVPLLLVLASVDGHAADGEGSFAVKGVGLKKCSEYVQAVRDRDRESIAAYVGWLSGYITASNQQMDGTFDLMSWQYMNTLAAALMSYCDRNADDHFASASVRLGAHLHGQRLSEKSERVPVEHDGATHYVYREALRRAQAALADQGLYAGELDGQLSDATRAALERYQADKALPVNGVPDQRTLLSLFGGKSP